MEYYTGKQMSTPPPPPPQKKKKKVLQWRFNLFQFQHSSCTEAEEVQVDSQANVKPIFLKTEGGAVQVSAWPPLFNQDFLEKLSISSFNIIRLSSPKSSLMCPGCETDIGDLDQGCEHGRLGASQLKVARALCSPRYEQ